MYPFLYDSSTGVQYDEVVREHDLSPAPTLSFPRLPLPLPNIAAALPRLPAAFARDRASVNNRVLDADDAAVRSAAAQGSAAAAAGGGASSGEQYNAAAEAAAFLAAAQRKVLFLVTPKLQAYARQYYGCESLPGAPADALSEGSHWRQANINVSDCAAYATVAVCLVYHCRLALVLGYVCSLVMLARTCTKVKQLVDQYSCCSAFLPTPTYLPACSTCRCSQPPHTSSALTKTYHMHCSAVYLRLSACLLGCSTS